MGFREIAEAVGQQWDSIFSRRNSTPASGSVQDLWAEFCALKPTMALARQSGRSADQDGVEDRAFALAWSLVKNGDRGANAAATAMLIGLWLDKDGADDVSDACEPYLGVLRALAPDLTGRVAADAAATLAAADAGKDFVALQTLPWWVGR